MSLYPPHGEGSVSSIRLLGYLPSLNQLEMSLAVGGVHYLSPLPIYAKQTKPRRSASLPTPRRPYRPAGCKLQATSYTYSGMLLRGRDRREGGHRHITHLCTFISSLESRRGGERRRRLMRDGSRGFSRAGVRKRNQTLFKYCRRHRRRAVTYADC